MGVCGLRDTIVASEQVGRYLMSNAVPNSPRYRRQRARPSGRSHTSGSTDSVSLTKIGRGLIAAPMINAATILIVRRRRSLAVRAVVCV